MAGVDFDVQARNAKALQRSTDNLAKILGAIGVGGKLGLADVGIEAVNRLRAILSMPGSGRTYRRPGARGPRAVIHRASAPGKPPAVDTGQFRASWAWETGEDPQGPFVQVGTNDKRAPWFEYGTRRMRPRPSLRPTIASMTTQIGDLVSAGIISEQRAVLGRLPAEVSQ